MIRAITVTRRRTSPSCSLMPKSATVPSRFAPNAFWTAAGPGPSNGIPRASATVSRRAAPARARAASRLQDRESAVSEVREVVLGIVIKLGGSTSTQGTGRKCRIATNRQRRSEVARLEADPLPPSSCEEVPGRPPARRWTVQVQSVTARTGSRNVLNEVLLVSVC